MSEDEVFVLIGSTLVSIFTWGRWLYEAATCARLGSGPRVRWTLFVYPLVCAAILLAVLRAYASWDVRESTVYTMFYLVMGAAWVGLFARILSFFGLSARDDVVERRNPAAGHAIGGALIGLTLCFAGGNIGDGPGWWVVVFAALLSTLAFLLLWSFLHRFTGLAEAITVERDPASGFRLTGYFIGSGLILGRAVAGDWESATGTVVYLTTTAWPVVFVWAAVALMERTFRPTHEHPLQPTVTHGLAPMAAYVALAAFFAAQAGWW